MAERPTRGRQVAQALMVQAMMSRSDADIVAFVAAQLGDIRDDCLMSYIAHRLDLIAVRLEAEDAPANKGAHE